MSDAIPPPIVALTLEEKCSCGEQVRIDVLRPFFPAAVSGWYYLMPVDEDTENVVSLLGVWDKAMLERLADDTD